MELPTFYVFADGACINNHVADAKARKGGMGVCGFYTASLQPREPFIKQSLHYNIETEGPSNQRCELLALNAALILVETEISTPASVIVVTDSKYVMGCLQTWYVTWEKNGWKNAKGKPVENSELIKPSLTLIRRLAERGIKVSIKHVEAHRPQPKVAPSGATHDEAYQAKLAMMLWQGNKLADALANDACT